MYYVLLQAAKKYLLIQYTTAKALNSRTYLDTPETASHPVFTLPGQQSRQ